MILMYHLFHLELDLEQACGLRINMIGVTTVLVSTITGTTAAGDISTALTTGVLRIVRFPRGIQGAVIGRPVHRQTMVTVPVRAFQED